MDASWNRSSGKLIITQRPTMRPETQLLAAILLKCHAKIRSRRTAETVKPADLIPYKQLCEQAGIPDITRVVGNFLGELALWCNANGLPPLNSLAINGKEFKPGPGYDGAVGCSEINWWNEVQACIASDYPPHIP
jgi:hypothetical protein